MRRALTFLATASVVIGATVFIASPAHAHGYISSPPSRQAMCAQPFASREGPRASIANR